MIMFGIMAAQIYGRPFGAATNLYSIWLHEIHFCLTTKDLIYSLFIPRTCFIILWGLSFPVFTGTCEIVILMASGHKQLWHPWSLMCFSETQRMTWSSSTTNSGYFRPQNSAFPWIHGRLKHLPGCMDEIKIRTLILLSLGKKEFYAAGGCTGY